MLKYVIFSSSYEGLPIAKKLKEEGNWVLVAYEPINPKEDPEAEKRRVSLYDGMVSKIPVQEAIDLLLKVPDKENYFVWFDFNNLWKYADQLRGKGFNGNFPTEEDEKFEKEREFAKDFVKKNYPNVKVAEVHEFKKVKEAEDFLFDTQELWVLKGNDGGAKTVVPESSDPETAKQEILDALKNPDYEKGGFILELKIKDVVEITPQKVYWNGEPLFTNVDIENKRIGAGDIGMMTGCAQDLIIQTELESYINEIAFPPIVDEMAKQHEGMFIWDISLLFDKRTGMCYMGEFCANRNGYNALYAELSMLSRVSDYFEAISRGRNPFDKSTGRFGASIRLFSLSKDKDLTAQEDDVISSEKATWLLNVKKENGKIILAGYWWQNEYADVAVATSYGNSLEDAASSAYEEVKEVLYPGMFYRPLFDYVSYDYLTSIPNRFDFLTKHKLITIPEGELKKGKRKEASPYYAKQKADEKDYEEFYKGKYEKDLNEQKGQFSKKIKSLSKKVQDALNE